MGERGIREATSMTTRPWLSSTSSGSEGRLTTTAAVDTSFSLFPRYVGMSHFSGYALILFVIICSPLLSSSSRRVTLVLKFKKFKSWPITVRPTYAKLALHSITLCSLSSGRWKPSHLANRRRCHCGIQYCTELHHSKSHKASLQCRTCHTTRYLTPHFSLPWGA